MNKEILDKQSEIEKIKKRLDRNVKYYLWITGIAIGLLISYIIHTL